MCMYICIYIYIYIHIYIHMRIIYVYIYIIHTDIHGSVSKHIRKYQNHWRCTWNELVPSLCGPFKRLVTDVPSLPSCDGAAQETAPLPARSRKACRWVHKHQHRKVWLVVSTHLKNISQLGWLFPIYGKIKNVPNHQPECLEAFIDFSG